jgi:thiol:disulfide interchange protein
MIVLNYLGLAFLSGILLNVMPCVLPILSMKVFHLMESRGHSKANALAYTAGIVAVFSVLAATVVALKALGHSLQWGMHFQSPLFVAALTTVVFAFALNALGLFELNIGMRAGRKHHGLLESFFSGIFAAVMSTPCTAPLLITVTGFALAIDTSAWLTFSVFVFIGLGLAFPFLVISFFNPLKQWLPRPGAWTQLFKEIMGFTLLATAIWLYSVLQKQLTSRGAIGFLLFLWVLAVALWSIGKFAMLHHSIRQRRSIYGMALLVVIIAGYGMLDFTHTAGAIMQTPVDKISWVAFEPNALQGALAQKHQVFVDFTADWCAACKTNEQLFLETDRLRHALAQTNTIAMKADMTNENPMLEAWLTKLGRTGIPTYVIYRPDGSHELLPILINTDLIVQRLQTSKR